MFTWTRSGAIAAACLAAFSTLATTAVLSAAESDAIGTTGQTAILLKAAPVLVTPNIYTSEDTKALAAVGSSSLLSLTHLELGAYYVAAESDQCNQVTGGGLSLRHSAIGKPVFFADCSNGGRFIISAAQAAEAIRREAMFGLTENHLKPTCTADTIEACKN